MEFFKENEKILVKENRNEKNELYNQQFVYDKEKKYFKQVSYFDENGNGVLVNFNENKELISKTQCKTINGEIVKHGTYEAYKNGKIVKTGGYLEGHQHGNWLNKNGNNLERSYYENGKELSKKYPLKQQVTELTESVVDIFTEKRVEVALKKLLHTINQDLNNKIQKAPKIKIKFEKEPKLLGEILGYTNFFDNGLPKEIIAKVKMNEKNEKIYIGDYVEYYDNSQIKRIGQYDENGEEYGEWKYFDKNGKEVKKTKLKEEKVIPKIPKKSKNKENAR